WLALAVVAAGGPFIAVAVIPRPSPAPPIEVAIVLTMSAVSFGACWAFFVGFVLQRRRRARAFLRDAVLIDRVITQEAPGNPGRGMGTGATVSFATDSFARRADLGLGHNDLEGAAAVLFAPGADTVLVFPDALGGSAMRAHARGDIIEHVGLVTVVLRRGFF